MSRDHRARPYREIVESSARALADWPDPDAPTRPIDELAVIYSPTLRRSLQGTTEAVSQPRRPRRLRLPGNEPESA